MWGVTRDHPREKTQPYHRQAELGLSQMCTERAIRITCLCDLYPLTPHFYIVNWGLHRGIHNFLIFALKHRLWVHVGCTHNLCFEQK